MTARAPFLGRGWAFPPELDAMGELRMASGEDDIRESLRVLFTTGRGERLMRPEYGGGLERFVFARIDDTSVALLVDAIRFAILHFEPRGRVQDVLVDRTGAADGRMLFDVRYTVIQTNTRSNMVFPYYLGEGTNLRDR